MVKYPFMKYILPLLIVIAFSCKKDNNPAPVANLTQHQKDSIEYYAHITYAQKIDSLGIEINTIYTVSRTDIDSGLFMAYREDSMPSGYGFLHKFIMPKDTIVFNADSTVTETWHTVKYLRDTSFTNPSFYQKYYNSNSRTYAIALTYDTAYNTYDIKCLDASFADTFYNTNFYKGVKTKTSIKSKNDSLLFNKYSLTK